MGNHFSLLKLILIISVSAWLGACGSGGDSESPDDVVDSGNTGVSKTVAAGEVLELAVSGAVVSIPADALEPGVVVTLTEVDPASLDEPPNGAGETLITPIYSLEFSDVQPSLGLIRFALDIPASVLTGSYARIKVKGGLDAEGETDTDWLAELGEHDATQSLLVLNLYATATRFLVTGLSSSPAAASRVATGSVTREASRPQLMAERLAATAAKELLASNQHHVWNDFGWVLLCDPKQFKKFNLTSCDYESPEFLPMMNRLAPKLYAADKRLTSLGFPLGSIRRVTFEGIMNDRIPYVVYDPDDRSVAYSNSTGKKLGYAIAWADPNTTDNILGAFTPSTSRVRFDIDTGDNGTVIHELMHAVQRVEIHNMYGDRNKWIREGIAAATRPFSSGYSGPAPIDYRRGSWRDWKYPLTNHDSSNHYKSVEFWLSLTGNLSSIPSFYDNLRGDSSSIETNSQLQVDAALTAAGLPSLGQAYTDLILQRNGQAGYPHCAGEAEAVIRLCSGRSCSTLVEELYPVSAQCLFENISFESCNDQPVAMTVTLEPDSPNPNMKLIVDGVLYDANTPVDFPENGKRVWVVNTDLEAVNTSPGPTAKLVFRNETTCETYLALRAQEFVVRASASTHNSVLPEANGSAGPQTSSYVEGYTSDEQQPALSSRSYRYIDFPINETGEEPIAAIGFDSFALDHTAFAQWAPEAPATGEYQAATGFGSLESYSELDGRILTTSGSLQSTSTSTDPDHTIDPSNGKVFGGGAASVHYFYKTLNYPAEVTLTWPCEFTQARLWLRTYPNGIPTEKLLSLDANPQFGDEFYCATESWQIPAKTEFYINFSAAANSETVNEGALYPTSSAGDFEIMIEALVPD